MYLVTKDDTNARKFATKRSKKSLPEYFVPYKKKRDNDKGKVCIQI